VKEEIEKHIHSINNLLQRIIPVSSLAINSTDNERTLIYIKIIREAAIEIDKLNKEFMGKPLS